MHYLRGGGDGSSPPPDDLEAGFRFGRGGGGGGGGGGVGTSSRGGSASPSLSAPVTPAAAAPATIASRRSGARAPADFAAATWQLQQQHEMFKQQQQQQAMQQQQQHQAQHAQFSRSIPSAVHGSSSSSSHSGSSSKSSKKSSSSRTRHAFDSPPDSDPDERRPRGEKSMRRRMRSWMRRFKHKRRLLALLALVALLALMHWRSRIYMLDIPPGLSDHSRPSTQLQPSDSDASVSKSAGQAPAHEHKPGGGGGSDHHKHHAPQLAMPSAALRAHVETDPTVWRLEDETDYDRALLNASVPVPSTSPYSEDQAGLQSSRRLSMQNFHNPLLRTRAPNAAQLIAAEQAAAAAAAAATVAAGGSPPSSSSASSPPPPRAPFPVTIFTTMRDLTFSYQQAHPLEYIKTWNALRSWRRLGWRDAPTVAPDGRVVEGELHPPDVLLFVDHGPESCDHLRREKLLDMRGIQCISIPCFNTEYKKPFMHCIWNLALAHARTEHLTFLNGDVVLLDDFWHSFQTAAHAMDHFVMVAQRRDVPTMDYPRAKLNYFIQVLDSDEETVAGDDDMGGGAAAPVTPRPKGSSFVYEFPFHDPAWLLQFRRHVASQGVVHPDSGIDMFCFHRRVLEMFEFQHFLVGVYRWDNWLLAQLLLRSANSPYERTHGLEFHYAEAHKFHGHYGVENDTHVAPDEDELGADNTLRHHSISFLVIDATSCMSLIHDSFRSDHLRDAGASYADQLVKNKIGLRYRVGRIGNADLVMRVAAHNHEHKAEETDAMLAADGCPHVCTGDADGMCYLEWNVASDRLDLQLVRQASATGAVAVVTVSRPFLALASNFLCWYAQRARMGARQLIVLAEDVASYRVVLGWDIDVPVLLFPEARDLPLPNGSAPLPTIRESSAQFSAWRLSVIGRMLDQAFTVLLTDLDTLWFDQPWTGLGNFLALFQAEEFVSTRHAQYQASALDQQEYKPIQVTQCTILAATKRVPRGSKPVQPVAEALGTKPPPPPTADAATEMLSTSFMLLTPNRYSRYLWKKLQECSASVWQSYSAIVNAAENRAPCRYIEERCLHDLIRGMHNELTGSEFQTCKLPPHYFLEHNRLRMPRVLQPHDDAELDPAASSPSSASSMSAALSGDDPENLDAAPAAATTVVSGVVLQSVNRWTWANDPSVEVGASFLKLSARAPLQFSHTPADSHTAQTPAPLPPIEEVLGLSTHSEAGYFHPRLLHDSSSGSVAGVAAKVNRWKHSGLWCVFRPDLMRKALIDPSPPLALPFPAPTPLPAGAPPRPTVQGVFLRIHLHLSPTAGLTSQSLGAFLHRLSVGTTYPPQDTVDIELDLGEFRRSTREQQRDTKRKERLAAAATAASSTGTGKPAGAASVPPVSAPSDEDSASSSRLTFSEIVDQFQKWNWSHGMKLLLPAVDASLVGDPSDAASMAAAAKKRASLSPHELTMVQAQEDALRMRFRGEDWVVTYSYREGGSGGGVASTSTGADVPILLLTPAVHLSPSWFVFLRRQLSQWPKRHDELSGVERRWFGLSLMPLVESVGDMELATQGHPAGVEPYPPASAMLARVPRTETWDVHDTGALQLLGEEYTHVEAERFRAEAGPNSLLNATLVSGRYWSGVQRTQLVNPLGLVVFSSSIHHLNAWKKAHVPPPSHTSLSEADAHSADYSLPCWARITTTDASTHTHAQAHYPHMTALLRYLFETGSFVTAPAPHAMGLARMAREVSAATEEDDTFTPSEAVIQERERQAAADIAFDASTLFLPPALGALPLFDVSGASVPLPDTLAYRHHILKAAHGFGEYDAADSSSSGVKVDPHVGCPWPALHPKLESTFYVRQTTLLE